MDCTRDNARTAERLYESIDTMVGSTDVGAVDREGDEGTAGEYGSPNEEERIDDEGLTGEDGADAEEEEEGSERDGEKETDSERDLKSLAVPDCADCTHQIVSVREGSIKTETHFEKRY